MQVDKTKYNQVVTLYITRNDVVAVFKRDVKIHIENSIYKRQFRVPEATINNVISQGGVIEITLAQLQSFIINRLNENL
jgi:hypothetical protein